MDLAQLQLKTTAFLETQKHLSPARVRILTVTINDHDSVTFTAAPHPHPTPALGGSRAHDSLTARSSPYFRSSF